MIQLQMRSGLCQLIYDTTYMLNVDRSTPLGASSITSMLVVSTSVFSAVMRQNLVVSVVSRALEWLGFTCHFLAASCDEREEMDGARSDQLALLRPALHDLAAT
jgi:hypothetical protein